METTNERRARRLHLHLAAAAATAAESRSACEPSRSLARSKPTHFVPPARCKACGPGRARQRSLTYCSRAAYNHGLHTVRHPATIQAWSLALSLEEPAAAACRQPCGRRRLNMQVLHPMQNSLPLPSCQAFGYLFVTVTSCVAAVAMEAQDEVPCETTSGRAGRLCPPPASSCSGGVRKSPWCKSLSTVYHVDASVRQMGMHHAFRPAPTLLEGALAVCTSTWWRHCAYGSCLLRRAGQCAVSFHRSMPEEQISPTPVAHCSDSKGCAGRTAGQPTSPPPPDSLALAAAPSRTGCGPAVAHCPLAWLPQQPT